MWVVLGQQLPVPCLFFPRMRAVQMDVRRMSSPQTQNNESCHGRQLTCRSNNKVEPTAQTAARPSYGTPGSVGGWACRDSSNEPKTIRSPLCPHLQSPQKLAIGFRPRFLHRVIRFGSPLVLGRISSSSTLSRPKTWKPALLGLQEGLGG